MDLGWIYQHHNLLAGFLIGIIIFVLIRHALSPEAIAKRETRGEEKKRLGYALSFTFGDLWVCASRKINETGGKLGTPACEIVIARHDGLERMTFCGPFWNIQEGDCVRLRFRTKRDEPAWTHYPPFGDVLVPERGNLLPP